MATPSKKAPEVEKFLEEISGRTTAITHNFCVREPIGCGGPATEFKDEVSWKEYTISGLCQKCQDKIFPPNTTDFGDSEGEDDEPTQ